eukprot:COSAG06_NODE_17498_length_938_cov_0.789035_1_plen_87_part_00
MAARLLGKEGGRRRRRRIFTPCHQTLKGKTRQEKKRQEKTRKDKTRKDKKRKEKEEEEEDLHTMPSNADSENPCATTKKQGDHDSE